MAFWIVVCPSSHWLVTVGSAVLYVTTIGFMAATATTDPGIVPRNSTIDDATAAANAQQNRTVEVNGVRISLKWCRTCKIFRPPRAAHCSECNVCVERFDHHCPWMGQCIGRRNYRFFLGFVVSVCLLALFVGSFSAAMALRVARHAYSSVRKAPDAVDLIAKAVSLQPVAIGTVAFPGLVLLCVGPLACYHCTLVCQNKTTSEEIKVPYGDTNPFAKDCAANCHEACCESFHRGVQPRSLASEDMGTAAMLADEGEPNDHSPASDGSSPTNETSALGSAAAAVVPVGEASPTERPTERLNTAPDSAACKPCAADEVASLPV